MNKSKEILWFTMWIDVFKRESKIRRLLDLRTEPNVYPKISLKINVNRSPYFTLSQHT